jgi:predicted peroxiredoxin
MENAEKKLVIVASRGHDDERATVSWTVANGGLNSGLDVTMFLVSSAIDIVRKGAIEHYRMNPLDPPMKDMVEGFLAKGGKILVCPPCANVRGYTKEHLLDEVEIVGSPALHALIKDGASTLSF